MGHARSGVTQQHYTAQSLETLRAAVESIRLALSTGQVIELPMRLAAGAPEGPKTDGRTAELTAALTAARGKAPRQSFMNLWERDTRFKLVTFGLGSRRSTN